MNLKQTAWLIRDELILDSDVPISLQDLEDTLEADRKHAGRLPGGEEIRILVSPMDPEDDEASARVEALFPATTALIEAQF